MHPDCHLPSSLDIWSLLAASLTKALPASDEFDNSDAALMSALAFVTEVLKYPFVLVDKTDSADKACIVTVCNGGRGPTKTAEVYAWCQTHFLILSLCSMLSVSEA